VLGEVPEERRGGGRHVDVLRAVEHDGGAHQVGDAPGQPQRPRGAHREPQGPHRGGRRGGHVVQGEQAGPHEVGHGVHVALGQHGPGLVGVVGGAAAEQVGRQGHEPLLGEPVAQALEERREPPPRVQHQDPRPVAGVGHGDVAGAGGSGSHGDDRTEADRRSTTRRYAWPSWLPETESTAAPSAGPSGSPPGTTRTTCAGSPTARSARPPWWCGAGTAPTSPPTTATTWRGAWPRWPTGSSTATTSTTTCATSPTTGTPTPARSAGSSGTGSGGTARPPASSAGAARDRRDGTGRGRRVRPPPAHPRGRPAPARRRGDAGRQPVRRGRGPGVLRRAGRALLPGRRG